MDRERAFFQDIMLQQFSVGTFYNPTRFIMLYAMLKDGKFKSKYTFSELVSLIFDAYCDNPHVAIHHPNLEIRKIPLFGKEAVKKDLTEALKDWFRYSKSDVLLFDGYSILFELDDSDAHISVQTKKILDVLFLKNFKTKFNGYTSLDKNILLEDTDLSLFGKSKYRDRVFADMQFCPLCEECSLDKLYVVHILPSKFCQHYEQMEDVNNGLILCQEHAQEYLDGNIYFDERGRLISLHNSNINGLRLPISIYKQKKLYIESYLEKIKNNP